MYFLCLGQPLRCHVNEKGKDPVPTNCKADKKVCGYVVNEIENSTVIRKCRKKGKDGRCMKVEGHYIVCACAIDYCNLNCTAESCKDGGPTARQMTGLFPPAKICCANCKSPEGGSRKGDQKPTGDCGEGNAAPNGTAATGDGIQRVADSKKNFLAFWILTTLVTFILTH